MPSGNALLFSAGLLALLRGIGRRRGGAGTLDGAAGRRRVRGGLLGLSFRLLLVLLLFRVLLPLLVLGLLCLLRLLCVLRLRCVLLRIRSRLLGRGIEVRVPSTATEDEGAATHHPA